MQRYRHQRRRNSLQLLDEHRSVERFHRTLADGWHSSGVYNSEKARRAALPARLHHQYNHLRAHTAIEKVPPITRLTNRPAWAVTVLAPAAMRG